jgi:hypothetical protein
MSTLSTTNLKNASSGSNNIVLDSSGRVLVGTSTARSNLYGGSLTAALQVEGTTYGTSSLSMIANGSSSAQNPYPILYLGRSRNATVGLNTVVQSGDQVGAVVFTGADGTNLIPTASIESYVDGTPGTNDMPGRLVFSTTADGASSLTERMRISQNGDMFINCTSGFSGQLTIARNGERCLTLQNTATGSTSQEIQNFYRNSTQVGSITTTNAATAYNTSSDYRLKENVVPLTGAIGRVNQLQVRRFNFIADPDKTVDGFIAHEAQAVVPECVTGEKDAVDADGNPVMQGIDQSKLVPLLTAALQEAITEIASLKNRVAVLEAS